MSIMRLQRAWPAFLSARASVIRLAFGGVMLAPKATPLNAGG
jgi:hypothetical protein